MAVRVGRTFTVEKVMSGVNVKKLSATTTVRVSALEKDFMSVAQVGKPSAATADMFNTRKHTLEKGHINVVNVGNSLAKFIALLNTREFIVVPNLTDAKNVENYLLITLIL